MILAVRKRGIRIIRNWLKGGGILRKKEVGRGCAKRSAGQAMSAMKVSDEDKAMLLKEL